MAGSCATHLQSNTICKNSTMCHSLNKVITNSWNTYSLEGIKLLNAFFSICCAPMVLAFAYLLITNKHIIKSTYNLHLLI